MTPARAIPAAAALLAALVSAQTRAEGWTPPPAKDGYSYPECYCTNRGLKVPMGALTCLTVGRRMFLARCAMSLNNPIWREVQDGCPSSRARIGATPSPAVPLQGVEPG